MTERVLVCVLAQTRGHELTWANFNKHVLQELQADLALCIGVDDTYDTANPFWQHARYRWTSPEFADFGDGFDIAHRAMAGTASPPEWRRVLQVKSEWLGGIGPDRQPGAGGLLIYFRWLLLHRLTIENLVAEYDRFIVTRSDFFWPCPHPPLSLLAREYVWLPDGEFYGGLTDRHLVVTRADLEKSLNLIDDILLHPDTLIEIMQPHSIWNIEQYLWLHYFRNGLLARVALFPYVMYAVRSPHDRTRAWGQGWFVEELGLTVKYRTELASSQAYQNAVGSAGNWESLAHEAPQLFRHVGGVGEGPGQLCQVTTRYQTVLYVEEASGLLKHRFRHHNDANLFLAHLGKGAVLLRRRPDGRLETYDVRLAADASDAESGPGLELAVYEEPSPLCGFSLSWRGSRLRAEEDGTVSRSTESGIFERFSILRPVPLTAPAKVRGGERGGTWFPGVALP